MPKLNRLIDQNTPYIFMAIGVFFIVMAIANFAGVPWVVKPRGSNDRWLYNKLGPIGYRVLFGFFNLFMAAIIIFLLKATGNI